MYRNKFPLDRRGTPGPFWSMYPPLMGKLVPVIWSPLDGAMVTAMFRPLVAVHVWNSVNLVVSPTQKVKEYPGNAETQGTRPRPPPGGGTLMSSPNDRFDSQNQACLEAKQLKNVGGVSCGSPTEVPIGHDLSAKHNWRRLALPNIVRTPWIVCHTRGEGSPLVGPTTWAFFRRGNSATSDHVRF